MQIGAVVWRRAVQHALVDLLVDRSVAVVLLSLRQSALGLWMNLLLLMALPTQLLVADCLL